MPDGSPSTGPESAPVERATDSLAERQRLAEELQRADAKHRLDILRTQLSQERSVGLEGIQKRAVLLRDVIRGNIVAGKDQEALLADLDTVHGETLADMQTKKEIDWMDRYAQQYLPYEWSASTKQRTALGVMYGGAAVAVIAGWKLLKRLWKGTKEATDHAVKQTKSGLATAAKWALVGTGIDHFFLGGRIRKTLWGLAQSGVLADAKEKAGELIDQGKQKVEDAASSLRDTLTDTRTAVTQGAETVVTSAPVRSAELAAVTPLILRTEINQADEAGLNIYDPSTEENVVAIMHRMEKSGVQVGTLREIVTKHAAPIDRGDALYHLLYAAEDAMLEASQKSALKRSCQFIVATFEKRQGTLESAYRALPDKGKPFENMTLLEAMNLLAENPLNITQKFGKTVIQMVENPAARTQILASFLESTFEAREFVTAEYAEWMSALTPEEQLTVRGGVLTKAIAGLELGIEPVSSAPATIAGRTDLNPAEKKLLTAIITYVQANNPATPDGAIARAMDGDTTILESLNTIWTRNLRLKDALQIHYLLRKAEGGSMTDMALRLKMLHLLSRYDKVAYGRAGGQMAGTLIEKTLGVATGVISIEEVPPSIRAVVELAAREAKEKGEDWLSWIGGLVTTAPGLVIAGAIALKLKLHRPANWLLTRPMALRNWQRSNDLRFLRYRRKALLLWLRTEPRSLAEIEQRFRVPSSVAQELQQLAEQFHDKQQKIGTLFRQTRMSLLISDTLMQISERRYSWLKSETDAKKIAQIYGLVTPDGKYDLEGAKAIQEHIAKTEAQAGGSASKRARAMQRAMQEIDRFADNRQSRLKKNGVQLDRTASVTGNQVEAEEETDATGTEANAEDEDVEEDVDEDQDVEEDVEEDVDEDLDAEQETEASDAAAEEDLDAGRASEGIRLIDTEVAGIEMVQSYLAGESLTEVEMETHRRTVQQLINTTSQRLAFLQNLYGDSPEVQNECSALEARLNAAQTQLDAMVATAVEAEAETTAETLSETEAESAAPVETEAEAAAPVETETPAISEVESEIRAEIPTDVQTKLDQWSDVLAETETAIEAAKGDKVAMAKVTRRLKTLKSWLQNLREAHKGNAEAEEQIDGVTQIVDVQLAVANRAVSAAPAVQAAASADIADIAETEAGLNINVKTGRSETEAEADPDVQIRGRR